MEPVLQGWTEFNVAVAGAGAALVGLLIVAMSVNIREILKAKTLPSRAALAIGGLTLGVVASCLALIPNHPPSAFGIEVLVGAILCWVLAVTAARSIWSEIDQPLFHRILKVALGVAPLIGYTVGSLIMLANSPAGYYWVAGGAVIAIAGGVLFSWVALVEILR
jgi:hypothetical protein